jgi:3-methyladenine DNA glycosylase AlkC
MADLLKNLYSTSLIDNLAKAVFDADPSFKKDAFIKAILDHDWVNKELKARTQHVSEQLCAFLPYSYLQQLEILQKVAPKFTGFTGTIFPTFVELFGQDDAENSLKALKFFTTYSTSEFAIRPFLKTNPSTIHVFYQWADHPNHHVRRLASEGCRPLLPWAMKLHQYVNDPSPIIPILEKLKNDPEDYVYRSVANNLNDISKHHPKLVLDLCEKWAHESKTTHWVAKHALRTLLKKGNQQAMAIFGYGKTDNLKIHQVNLGAVKIPFGGQSMLDIEVKNQGEAAKFRLEYTIGYYKKNGSHNEKVFQIKESELKKDEAIQFEKKLDFKDLSTRKHYRGPHYILFKVNGNSVKRIDFELE